MANVFLGEFDSLSDATLSYEYILGTTPPTIVDGWLRMANSATAWAIKGIPALAAWLSLWQT